MSQSKKRNVDEIEDLKREIKELHQIIKSLERQLKNENKKLTKIPKAKEEVANENTPDQARCEECGKGKIMIIDLSFRKLLHCDQCSYRRTIK